MRGFHRHEVVAIDVEVFEVRFCIVADAVAHPAQDHAAIVDGAAGDPDVINEVVAPRAAFRVGHRTVGQHAQRSARADRRTELAGLDGADADIDEHAVRRADDDGKPGGEPRRFGGLGRERFCVCPRDDGRQHVARDAGVGEDFRIPVHVCFVIEAARARSGVVDGKDTREFLEKIILERADVMHLRETLGQMLAEPENFCERVAGVNGAARLFIEAFRECRILLYLAHDVRAAAVRPGDHVRHRAAVLVERREAVHDGTQRDAGCDAVAVAQCRRGLADDFLDRLVDFERVLLRPVRVRRQELVERLRRRELFAIDAVGDGSHARRADIDADPGLYLSRIIFHYQRTSL